jgi:hypothetical protein
LREIRNSPEEVGKISSEISVKFLTVHTLVKPRKHQTSLKDVSINNFSKMYLTFELIKQNLLNSQEKI